MQDLSAWRHDHVFGTDVPASGESRVGPMGPSLPPGRTAPIATTTSAPPTCTSSPTHSPRCWPWWRWSPGGAWGGPGWIR